MRWARTLFFGLAREKVDRYEIVTFNSLGLGAGSACASPARRYAGQGVARAVQARAARATRQGVSFMGLRPPAGQALATATFASAAQSVSNQQNWMRQHPTRLSTQIRCDAIATAVALK